MSAQLTPVLFCPAKIVAGCIAHAVQKLRKLMPRIFSRTSRCFVSCCRKSVGTVNAWKRALAVALLLFSFPLISFANNLTISNVKVCGWNTTANTAKVQFDITWSNAWRDATNYDAAWVFIKYSKDNGDTWHHATLAHQGHTTPANSGIEIRLPTEPLSGYKGAFIEFSAARTSPLTLTSNSTKLVWDYGIDGVTDSEIKASTTKVKVFGIEMVYVPTGNFYIGDGASGNETAGAFHASGADNVAVQINTSSKIITCDASSYDDIDTSPVTVDGDAGITSSPANPSWPVGYKAFYMMKYELSHGQYRDFLNTLPRDSQSTRVASTITSDSVTNVFVMSNTTTPQNRNALRCPASGNSVSPSPITFSCDLSNSGDFNESNDGEWIAMNYLSWMDLCAYADWAALRPMTEFEFEKACRGPTAAVLGEYAWGSTNIVQAQGPAVHSGMNTEVANTTGNGLCNYNGGGTMVGGPLRCGFAASALTTTRAASGAGYYGVLEMSGNVSERYVTLGNTSGRVFQGTHGDGVLISTGSSQGNATNRDWPGADADQDKGVTGASGSGFRGDNYNDSSAWPKVSRRDYGAYSDTSRSATWGGRLGRTAEW